MKYTANVVTALRIPLAFSLLFVKPFSAFFLILYLICGFTDILDGCLARNLDITSKFGVKLDSIADLFTAVVLFMIFIPFIVIPLYIFLWMLLIIAVRIISMIVAVYKYHTFAILHTYTNKASGAALFCFPLLAGFVNTEPLAAVICMIASVAAIEELIIHISVKELNRDIVSIFAKDISS